MKAVTVTNILGQMPYVLDENVIHIGQRDAEETNKYGSQDIRETGIHCFDLDSIRREGIEKSLASIVRVLNQQNVQDYWLHFDTDVISDEENPAVDYRLPGGLSFEECKILLQTLIRTNSIVGLSVTIFNPLLDFPGGTIAEKITNLLSDALNQTHFSSGGANAY